MPKKYNDRAIAYLHRDPVTVTWRSQTGTERTVTGRIYRHAGILYVAGRRLTWFLDNEAKIIHADPQWLADEMTNHRDTPSEQTL